MTSKQPHRESKGRPKAASNKQKRAAQAAKRQARAKKARQATLQSSRDNRRAAYDQDFPPGAIPADLREQAPNNSYGPPLYYVDQPFDCVDCGRHEVWTASQQKWYFEVAKGPIYGRAIRCRAADSGADRPNRPPRPPVADARADFRCRRPGIPRSVVAG